MPDKTSLEYSSLDRRLTLDEMKQFLWGAATRLRGQIDAAGYKEYIFPLLFFKRISDVYDEQFNGYVAEGGEEYANMQVEDFAIKIPDGAHWRDVRSVTENVGQRLVETFIAIEQANPGVHTDGRIVGGLEGIFGPKDIWTNKNKMPDHIITSLIEDFSRYNLSIAACPADEMGQAYEYLVGKFADDAGNTAQEFYTNRTVVTLMAEILQPKPGESIYDPTCGSGGMLVKCLDYLREKGEAWQSVKVFGQEINALTSSIARMNLYLNGVEDFSIVREDTLKHPAFVDGSHLRTFDVVLANPPYSIKAWDRDAFANDKWGRNLWGTPIQARADYAFIQHIVSSMNPKTGRSATLLPHGVLNREEDKEIRLGHVLSDNIDIIIGLGRNLFYNSGLESFVLICNNNKPAHRKGKILFIDAEDCTHKIGKQAYLYDEDIQKILDAVNSTDNIPGFSCYVSNDEIVVNEGNLNIKSYVKPLHNGDHITINDSLKSLSQSSEALASILNQMPFTDVDIKSTEFDKVLNNYDTDNWTIVKLEDVATEYSERVENPSESQYDFFIGSDCIGQYDFRIHKKQPSSLITSTQKGFRTGDYLLVRRSLYGSDFRERAPRADFDGVCSADILTIREKESIIADGFLIYVLYQDSLWDFIVSNSNGGLTRRIKWKQLKDYEFKLPPLEIQEIISKRLWAAYQLKEAYKKLLVTTDEMVKSQFIEMFGCDQCTYLPLREVCLRFGEYGSNTPSIPFVEGQPRYIRITDLNYDGTLNDDKVCAKEIDKKYILSKGDFLFARTGATVGKTYCHREGDALYAGYLIRYVTNPDKILPEFLSIYTKTQPFWSWIQGQMKIGAQPNISSKQYNELPVPAPSIEEQTSFLSFVRQADKSKFDGFKSQFIEMFGNPLFSTREGAITLGEATDIILGSTPDSKNESYWAGELCWITPAELSEDSFEVNDTERHISYEGVKATNLTGMPIGTVLFSTRAPIGKVAITTTLMYCNQGFKNMYCKENLNNVFLYYTLKFNKAHLQSLGTGTTFKELSKKIIESINIFIPEIERQKQFEAIYRQADKSKFELKKAIEAIDQVIKSLING